MLLRMGRTALVAWALFGAFAALMLLWHPILRSVASDLVGGAVADARSHL